MIDVMVFLYFFVLNDSLGNDNSMTMPAAIAQIKSMATQCFKPVI